MRSLIFPVLLVLAGLRGGAGKGGGGVACWVSEVGPFFSQSEIMLGTVLDVSTYWWQGLLKPLTVDRR